MGQRDIASYETSMKRKNRIRAASMCRLDVDSAAKEVEQPRDALSSSRYLLGRGVKRKLSECDGAGDAASLGLAYPQQRQLVLDLCLDKLQSCQRRAEPSLHRSVLLANTLRHLQQEMRQEGSTATAACPPPPPAPSLHALTPRHVPDLPPVPSDLQPACGPPESPASGPDAGAQPDDGSGVHPAAAAAPPLQDTLFGAFEITSSASCYLSDLPLDDIFDDIDTSMYDASDFSALALTPAQRGSASGGGGSGDDGLKGFPSGCNPSSALQFCLTDLNDLDHIMEILVHS
ncbi:SERTA domain-containing protein 2 [Sardina pilchardus]|uniref:SERTA domain-containing protein 2 n=1 Tax=Sardina pilchardus TaxID=27697 RepID=UPI002E0E25F9